MSADQACLQQAHAGRPVSTRPTSSAIGIRPGAQLDIERRKQTQSTVEPLHAMIAYLEVEPITETIQNRPTCYLSGRALTLCRDDKAWSVCPHEIIPWFIP